MAAQTRTTLKGYFNTGDTPTETQFANLIDSVQNITDDGVAATASDLTTHTGNTSNPHSVTAAQASAVALTGNETVAGVKTFSSFPVTPSAAPTTDYQVANKKFVDDSIVAAGGYTDEQAQDAVGAMVDSSLTYTDATPELKVTNPVTPAATGFTITAGTTPKTLTVGADTDVANLAPTTSPTFATSITGSYLTASEMLITNGSKQIVSAAVATYPSLTELSYVKGLTSSAQTQLTARLPLAGGTMTGNILLGENAALQLDTTLSADEKYTGLVITGTMGYGATAGDLVYLAVADGKWELAKADAATTSAGKLGIVTATTSENSTCPVLLQGNIRSAAFPTLTVGAPVYISAATGGDITSTAPSGTTDFVVRKIGQALSADDLYFAPSNDYLELA